MLELDQFVTLGSKFKIVLAAVNQRAETGTRLSSSGETKEFLIYFLF